MYVLKINTSENEFTRVEPYIYAGLTTKVKNSVAGVDVRKETVSQALSLRRPFHQTGNIHDVQESWNLAGSCKQK